jgi:hypothetical protein
MPNNKFVRDKKIKEITSTIIGTRKGTKNQYSTTTFNKFGFVTRKASEKLTQIYYYKNDTLLTKIDEVFKGDSSSLIIDYEGKIPVCFTKNVKGEKIEVKKLIYTNQLLVSEQIFLKKFNKPYNELKHFYDSITGKRIRTEYYKKDKLFKVWSYECSQEGKVVSNKVENNSYCKWNEPLANGGYLICSRVINNKKEQLNKMYFTKDSTWYKTERFQNDSILIGKSLKIGNIIENRNFTLKGKPTSSYVSISDTNDMERISIHTFFRTFGRTLYQRDFEYNNVGLVKRSSFSYNGKVESNTEYTITYFE